MSSTLADINTTIIENIHPSILQITAVIFICLIAFAGIEKKAHNMFPVMQLYYALPHTRLVKCLRYSHQETQNEQGKNKHYRVGKGWAKSFLYLWGAPERMGSLITDPCFLMAGMLSERFLILRLPELNILLSPCSTSREE